MQTCTRESIPFISVVTGTSVWTICVVTECFFTAVVTWCAFIYVWKYFTSFQYFYFHCILFSFSAVNQICLMLVNTVFAHVVYFTILIVLIYLCDVRSISRLRYIVYIQSAFDVAYTQQIVWDLLRIYDITLLSRNKQTRLH